MWHLMGVHPDRSIAMLAVRQGGVVRNMQAFERGFTRGQIDQRVRDGRWRSIGRFGYRIIEMDGLQNLVRAAVAVLPNAVVSHEAAAEIHGFSRMPKGRASVSVHTQTTHQFPGVVVHRCHDLVEDHIVDVSGLPVTSIPRTIVDLSPHISVRHLSAVLASLVTERRVATNEVQAVVRQVARRGKPGIQNMRAVLAEWDAGPRDGTVLERAGASLLRSRGIPEPQFEFPMPWNPARRFDVAFPHAKLAIEWDSRRWHQLFDAFASDRQRDREALLHGWRVVRFTWADVTERPGEVADAVRRLLNLR